MAKAGDPGVREGAFFRFGSQATEIRELFLMTSVTLGNLLSFPSFQVARTTWGGGGLRGIVLGFAEFFEPTHLENMIQSNLE